MATKKVKAGTAPKEPVLFIGGTDYIYERPELYSLDLHIPDDMKFIRVALVLYRPGTSQRKFFMAYSRSENKFYGRGADSLLGKHKDLYEWALRHMAPFSRFCGREDGIRAGMIL